MHDRPWRREHASADLPEQSATADRAGPTPRLLVRDVIRLYNAITDADGTEYLLYGPGTSIICAKEGDGYNPATDSAAVPSNPGQLHGPVVIDAIPGALAMNGHPTTVTVTGRVSSAVRRLEVTVAGQTRTVAPRNGTYLLRFTFGRQQLTSNLTDVQVVGFGAHGERFTGTYRMPPLCDITAKGGRCVQGIPWR